MGLTGLVETKRDDNFQEDNKVLSFGIVIETGVFPFNRTKIIKIVPRYIIYNNLDHPIIVKQKNNTKQYLIQPQAKEIYFFENSEKDAFMMIRQLDEDEDQCRLQKFASNNENMWSSCFSIEDIEDF